MITTAEETSALASFLKAPAIWKCTKKEDMINFDASGRKRKANKLELIKSYSDWCRFGKLEFDGNGIHLTESERKNTQFTASLHERFILNATIVWFNQMHVWFFFLVYRKVIIVLRIELDQRSATQWPHSTAKKDHLKTLPNKEFITFSLKRIL